MVRDCCGTITVRYIITTIIIRKRLKRIHICYNYSENNRLLLLLRKTKRRWNRRRMWKAWEHSLCDIQMHKHTELLQPFCVYTLLTDSVRELGPPNTVAHAIMFTNKCVVISDVFICYGWSTAHLEFVDQMLREALCESKRTHVNRSVKPFGGLCLTPLCSKLTKSIVLFCLPLKHCCCRSSSTFPNSNHMNKGVYIVQNTELLGILSPKLT